MKAIYLAQHIIDAQLVRDALEAEGIPAHVAGAYLSGAMGELPVNDLIRVLVPDALEPEGRVVAVRVERELVESRAALAEDDHDPGLEPA
jgi:hypothetical protein